MGARTCAAARVLGRAGRWDDALALLEDEPADDREAALVVRELLADKAFWTGGPVPPDVPTGDGGGDGDGDVAGAWASRFARARADYVTMLQVLLAGRGVDREVAQELLARLELLRASAPARDVLPAVRFQLGLVLENLLGDPAAAEEHWRAAAEGDDVHAAASALRHLGGQAADAGDPAAACVLWWRSFRLRARAGDLPGALAQLVLLAPSTTVEEVVSVWVEEAGLGVLRTAGPGGS